MKVTHPTFSSGIRFPEEQSGAWVESHINTWWNILKNVPEINKKINVFGLTTSFHKEGTHKHLYYHWEYTKDKTPYRDSY